MSDDELKIETEHVQYWEDCLNSLSKHFEIIRELINKNKIIQDKRIFFIKDVKTKYKNDSKPFKKEPSHLFFLTEIYFDFYYYLGNVINSKIKKLLDNTIEEIIQNLKQTKTEICGGTLKLINKCKELILKIKKLTNDYEKAKTALDKAQIEQKKIKNLDEYTYNVGKKQKADLELSEKINDMAKIKNPLENNKKQLLELSTKLNDSIKNNFEIIISICFKHLSNYYQCIFLILNQRLDILINLRAKLNDILTQLSNLVFDLNDYSERKFGESVLGIKTEGLNIYSSGELMNKSSMKQLIEISNNIINYVEIFLKCLRYRKKIMKIFLEILSQIIKFETDNIKEYNENKKSFINQLDSLKIINNNCRRYLRNLISKEKNNEMIKEINSINSVINNYIEFVRNEHSTFNNNWKSYEKKIKDRQKISTDFLNEINKLKNSNKTINQTEFTDRNERKKRLLKDAILAGLDFIQKNVISTREKDKTEMMKLESTFEKIFLNSQNLNNEYISQIENELNNAAMTDIFDECEIVIIKYFNKFKIQNYENFLKRIKMKLLLNTDLSKGKLGKIVYENIKKGIDEQIEESKINNSLEDISFDNQLPSEYYFQRSRRSSVSFKSNPKNNPFIEKKPYDNPEFDNNKSFNKSIINDKISNLSKFNENNKTINYNNDKNKTKNKNILNKSKDLNDKNDNGKNEIEKGSIININLIDNDEESNEEFNKLTNNDILNELEDEDKVEFLNNEHFSKYIEVSDPYSNIKEDELDRLLNMKKESPKKDLEEGEEILDSFNCSLSGEILSLGSFIITNKKIEFNSSFLSKQKILIPLEDIISIEKKTSLGIDNSLEIKTEKVTHLFTSFLSRDHCFLILKNQLNKIKEEKKQDIQNNEEQDNNSPEQKYLKRKRFKAKQITKMLEEMEFYSKLERITNERMELFSKKYYDEKKGIFIPDSEFKLKYVDKMFEDCPLFIPFKVLCDVSSKLEEYKRDKGFFESLFLDRGDTKVKFEESIEFSKDIPKYFNDGDYVMNLFSQFNKEDIENFLNEIQNWGHKYEANCYAVHKVKQVPFGPSEVIMKNRYIVYFISPTCLIFDDLAFATGFQFCDNFMPLFRYKFDCNIKFNENKSIFEFKTRLTISYTTVFFASFILKGAVASKSEGDTEELIKGEVIDKLTDSLNISINKFKEIFERSTDETFQRKLDLKQNMITGELEEEKIDGLEEEDNKDEDEVDKKKEENQVDNNNQTKVNNGINQKINDFIEKYKLYIFIGIVSFTIIEIINSFFRQGSGSFAINTIFNLIILASIFYLFKFK